MDRMPKALKLAFLLVAVVAAGLALGWLATRPDAPAPAALEATIELNPLIPKPLIVRAAPAPPADAVAEAPAAALPAAPTTEDTEAAISAWERRVDSILTTDQPEEEKVRELLAAFPALPEEGQLEAAQHLALLTADEDFLALRPWLTNAALPEAVSDIFMAGLLDRPNPVKLPLLLEIARTEGHPRAEDARDQLTFFLEEDYGADWGRWETQMRQWLEENPD